jgi:hypothetical protein
MLYARGNQGGVGELARGTSQSGGGLGAGRCSEGKAVALVVQRAIESGQGAAEELGRLVNMEEAGSGSAVVYPLVVPERTNSKDE